MDELFMDFFWEYLFEELFAALFWPMFITVTVLIIQFCINGYLWTQISEKTGNAPGAYEWKAYLPFAREHYMMQIVELPAWRMLFFGSWTTMLMAILITLSFAAPSIIWLIIAMLYLVCKLVFSIEYYTRLYNGFGYSAVLAAVQAFLPPVGEVMMFVLGADRRRGWADGAVRVSAAGSAEVKAPRSAAAPKIIGTAGKYKEFTFDLSDGMPIIMGRNNDLCNVVFDQYQTCVSNKHCEIRYVPANDTYLVTNFSKNGTMYDNDIRIGKNETRTLNRGTEIYLGTRENAFHLS